jgi:hypothetical protein
VSGRPAGSEPVEAADDRGSVGDRVDPDLGAEPCAARPWTTTSRASRSHEDGPIARPIPNGSTTIAASIGWRTTRSIVPAGRLLIHRERHEQIAGQPAAERIIASRSTS